MCMVTKKCNTIVCLAPLVFDKVHPRVAEQLEKVVADLPAVESLHDSEAGALGTVVTEILES